MKTKIKFKTAHSLLCALWLVPSIGLSYAVIESRTAKNTGWQEEASVTTDLAPAQMLQKVDFVQQEMQELRGKVEELTHQLQQLSEQQQKLYVDLESRLASSVTTAPKDTTKSGVYYEPDEKIAPQAAVTPTDNNTEQQLYQMAYRQVQAKDYKNAIDNFILLTTNHPQSRFSGNAYYWLGEIYLNQAQLDLAEKAFAQIPAHYANHTKMSDALLKLGYIEYQKSQWQKAKNFLTQVKSQFPNTTASQLADARLQRMRTEGHL